MDLQVKIKKSYMNDKTILKIIQFKGDPNGSC